MSTDNLFPLPTPTTINRSTDLQESHAQTRGGEHGHLEERKQTSRWDYKGIRRTKTVWQVCITAACLDKAASGDHEMSASSASTLQRRAPCCLTRHNTPAPLKTHAVEASLEVGMRPCPSHEVHGGIVQAQALFETESHDAPCSPCFAWQEIATWTFAMLHYSIIKTEVFTPASEERCQITVDLTSGLYSSCFSCTCQGSIPPSQPSSHLELHLNGWPGADLLVHHRLNQLHLSAHRQLCLPRETLHPASEQASGQASRQAGGQVGRQAGGWVGRHDLS